MAHLLTHGPLTYAEIAEQLDAKLGTVIKTANRGQTFTKIVSVPDNITKIALSGPQRES